ncbi:MAG: hypothetical protein ACJ8J0_27650, partial [Longimicrobiaceae bacterium]
STPQLAAPADVQPPGRASAEARADAAHATPFVTRSMDDDPRAMDGTAPGPEPPPPTAPPLLELQPTRATEPPPPAPEPPRGPGAAHVPVFREASPYVSEGDGRAGISRENRDAVEAPRPDKAPREEG